MTASRVAVVTDSTADLPEDLRQRWGIVVVPVGVRFGGQTLRDGVDIGAEEFLARLDASPDPPRTVAPAVDDFLAAFDRLGRDHDGIVAVIGSGRLGSTVAVAREAAARAAVPVEVVDSRSATMGLGWQAVRAAELAAEGLDALAVADLLRSETGRYEVIFFVDTLEYLRRGARIGRAAAAIGDALDLKPLLRIDEGVVVPAERARTRARAVDALVESVRALGTVERAAALYVSERRDGEALAARLRDELGLREEQVVVARIGPGVATHAGPGALGVAVADLPD